MKELTIELHKHRERQKVLDARRTVEQCLDEETLRQDEIREAEEKLSAVEEVLRAAVKSEQEKGLKWIANGLEMGIEMAWKWIGNGGESSAGGLEQGSMARFRTARALWKPSLEAWTRTSGGRSTWRTQATAWRER